MRIPVNLLVPVLREPGPLEVERYATAPTINAYGEAVLPTPTILSIVMVAHQATRKQLERAGLDMGHDWRAFYSETELRTTVPGPADVVRYQGERWKLHNAANYQELGGLYMALGRRFE